MSKALTVLYRTPLFNQTQAMTNSVLFKQAHAMTKQVNQTGDCYRVTFGACLKLLMSVENSRKGATNPLMEAFYIASDLDSGILNYQGVIVISRYNGKTIKKGSVFYNYLKAQGFNQNVYDEFYIKINNLQYNDALFLFLKLAGFTCMQHEMDDLSTIY